MAWHRKLARTTALAAALLLGGCGGDATVDSAAEIGRSAATDRLQAGATIKLPIPGARNHATIVETEGGDLAYLLSFGPSRGDRLLTPDEFTAMVFAHQRSRDWWQKLLNISSPVGVAWVLIGLGGQLLFTGRMLVQWITSERSKRSVVPVSFWWMSLAGASMLLVYFIWRQDIVGVLGQTTGWIIYIRNLILIYRSRGG